MNSMIIPDAGNDETIRIEPNRFRIFLALFVCLGGMGIGVWVLDLFLHHPSEPKYIEAVWIGPLCVVLCGYVVWLLILRLWNGYRTSIGPEGLSVPGPMYDPKLIPWDDIEAIKSVKAGRSSYTGILLKTYNHLVPQFSAEEAKILLRRYRWLGRAIRVTAPMATVQTGIRQAINATQNWDDLAAFFAGQRQAYGSDVLLAAVDRDRNAEDFAVYLDSFRRKYSKVNSNA